MNLIQLEILENSKKSKVKIKSIFTLTADNKITIKVEMKGSVINPQDASSG